MGLGPWGTTAFPVRIAPIAVPDALIAEFLAGRSPRTLTAYQEDLEAFRRLVGATTIGEAAAVLLGEGAGPANALALRFRAGLVERGLAPATINRRLTALRSLVRFARLIGLVPFALEVQNIPAQPYRDTRGPEAGTVAHLLEALRQRTDAKGRRDYAIVRLLAGLGLRREEVARLDVADIDLEAGTIAVRGKGRRERMRRSLPPKTRAAVAGWLAARGVEPGPLFRNFDRAGKGERLTGTSIYRLVRGYGRELVQRAVRPHQLRHAAITAVLDLSGGDVRAAREFSRHQDVKTVLVYDDNRRDLAGTMAARLEEAW